MARVTFTTDMGDWSTLPRRVRLAVVTLVVAAIAVGIASVFGPLSLPAAVVLLAALGIGWVLVFDRRRSWWPDEPTVPVDPVGRDARRNIVTAVAVVVVTVVLVLAGVLQF